MLIGLNASPRAVAVAGLGSFTSDNHSLMRTGSRRSVRHKQGWLYEARITCADTGTSIELIR